MGYLLGGATLAAIISALASKEVSVLLGDALKVGITSLVISKVAKTIGQKDIAEIIHATGWCVIALDVVKACAAISNWLKS
jgi:hypothetical protein